MRDASGVDPFCGRQARRGAWLVPLAALLVALVPGGAARAAGPNIVFILADDLGWADTTLYGHTSFYRTPNLERLAKRGMTFTRAYSASPLCSPTRSAILTGLSPARTGITQPVCHLPEAVLEAAPGAKAPPGKKAIGPQSVTRLKTEYPTITKALKAAGYATGHFGKWHLGPEPYSPLEHGFDVDVPHHPGPGPAGSYVAPWKFKDFDPDPDAPDEHLEDRMAREAVAWMERVKERPFFLNYWMFSVHAPFDAKQAVIEKYRRSVDPAGRQRSPTYAAMVESMDDAVGTLLDALDRLGIADDTIVIFTSDNGGNMYNAVDGTTATNNAPLRGGKATIFEGGVRVPQVIAWPGITRPGSTSDVLTQSEDFYPTLLAGLGLPAAAGQIFDGVSILPALRGEPQEHPPVFTYFPYAPPVPEWAPESAAVHAGGWKLIRLFHQGEDGRHRHLLFDLDADLGERSDRAAELPDRVRELDGLIEGFLDRTEAVRPMRNPAFDIAAYHPEQEGKGTLKPEPRPGQDDPGDPALQGWKVRNASAAVKDGVVTVFSELADPFLGVAAGVSGPARVTFRAKSATGGSGQAEWLPAGKENEAGRQPYDLPAGDWSEVTVEIPATGPLGIVRIRLPEAALPVQIDHVELTGANHSRRWDF
jgi:arylsulfatase A-like enzyme